MKIRRFVAADMRSALQLVREAHGADAVILSNRRTDEGIEIVAASSYDEEFVQRAIEETRRETVVNAPEKPPEAVTEADPEPVPAPAPAPPPAPAPACVLAPAPRPLQPAPVPVPDLPTAPGDGEMARLREELAQMRQMIEREMVRLTDERLRGSPVRAQAMDLMDEYGFDAGITRDVVLQIPADTPAHRARGLMLGLISRRLPICPIDPLQEAGVIALVGPTGAGKTTTIAKLAGQYAARHQARDVALVTTDTVRVGGREQLHGYGRELGIAVHEADSEAGLLQLLQRLQDYRLVLIDTAGMSQRDRALAAQLHWLRAARQARSLLVLPANTHFSDLDEVVRRFQAARPQGVVLTKLDETSRLGSALSVVADHELPLTWTTDGQRIPEDLSRANAARLVLRLEVLRREADKPFIPEYQDAIA